MMDHAESIFYAVAAMGAGLFWFFTGFRELKDKRTVENIPTSKIATGAVGTNVEIKGSILIDPDKMLTAPISERPCTFYSIEIQQLVRTKDRSYWKTIDQFYSDKGFYVEDGSGANARVMVEGAKVKRKGETRDFYLRSNQINSMPSGLLRELTLHAKELKRFKLQETSFLFSKQYRFREWCFQPGEPVYVLGYADSGVPAPKRKKLKFKTFLKAKKMVESDEKLKARFDVNGDGVLDPEEMEHGAKVIAAQLESKYSPKQVEELVPRTKMVFKKRDPFPFLISNMMEDQLVKKMNWQAALKVWGGPAVTIAGVVYLVFVTVNV